MRAFFVTVLFLLSSISVLAQPALDAGDRGLVEDVENNFQRGDVARAGRLARLAAETYPESDDAAGVCGVFLALAGNEAEADVWLRLTSIARSVTQMGQPERAANLVRVAERIHAAR